MLKKISKQFSTLYDWWRFNPPYAQTFKGWRLFNDEFKKSAPVRYYFNEVFPQKYWWPVKGKFRHVSDWIRFRTYDRYHVLKTGQPPGYMGPDWQMFFVSFNILKDFVEIEKAWMSSRAQKKTLAERFIPFYFSYNFRNPELGIEHLVWECSLDDPDLPPEERSTDQAVAAREILSLYMWWTVDRPARKEIETPAYNYQGDDPMFVLDEDFDKTAEDYVEFRKAMDKSNEQHEQWLQEDDAMFMRLIKVRRHLWT